MSALKDSSIDFFRLEWLFNPFFLVFGLRRLSALLLFDLSSVAEFSLQLRRASLGPFRLHVLKRCSLGYSSQLVSCLTGLNAKCWEINGVNSMLNGRYVSRGTS